MSATPQNSAGRSNLMESTHRGRSLRITGKNPRGHTPGATGARSARRARRRRAAFSLREAQTPRGFVSRRHYSLPFWHHGACSSARISGIRRSEGEPGQAASGERWASPSLSEPPSPQAGAARVKGGRPRTDFFSVKPSCRDSSPQLASRSLLVHLTACGLGLPLQLC